MDLIDRQAAIDALCAVCGKSCDKSEFVYNAPQDEQVILCPEHYCLCTLPSAQTDLSSYSDKLWRAAYERGKEEAQPHWIPVTERLPEYGTQVLTIDKDGDCEINHVIDEEDGEWFLDGVIAWMPLPDPYKEERDEI